MKNYLLLGALLTLMVSGIVFGRQRKSATQPTAKPSPNATPSPGSGAAPSPTPEKKLSQTESLIEITLNTSRRQVTAGSGFGIVAEIRNKSDQGVYLRPKYLTMIPPPEINRGRGAAPYWYADMPPDPAAGTDGYEKVVYLAPGAKTSASWIGDGPWDNPPWWQPRFLTLVSFAPGEYTMKVVGSYWTDEESAKNKNSNYQSESAEIKVLVAAPQTVILLGAIVGGLIAYFLLPNTRLHPQQIDPLGLLTAILLSSIVTILLARLSETQFIVRVSINDFWGAIAIGFIASAWGTSILQRFIPDRSSAARSSPGKLKDWWRRGRKKTRRDSQAEDQTPGDAPTGE
jgi:hypothetical protein